MTADPDFASVATRIRDNVGRQGFMSHIGAELSELMRGSCTLPSTGGPNCCSSTACSMAASPPFWSTMRPRSRRRPRAARRR